MLAAVLAVVISKKSNECALDVIKLEVVFAISKLRYNPENADTSCFPLGAFNFRLTWERATTC